MKHLDLFSGIGGFAVAAREVWKQEYETTAFCDNDYFCQQVLKKNFPGVPICDNIRALTNTDGKRCLERKVEIDTAERHTPQLRFTERIDLITGGFPCQPFSQAGKRKGTEDDRYLWPEMLRVIREFQPRWVIGENVAGLITWSDGLVLEQVCADLEAQEYEVQPFIIPACAVNAPHRRDRVWIIAHSQSDRSRRRRLHEDPKVLARQILQAVEENGDEVWSSLSSDNAADARTYTNSSGEGLEGRESETRKGCDRFTSRDGSSQTKYTWNSNWYEVATEFCRVDDGLPKRVVRLPDGNSISRSKWRKEALKAYGNAIVPQVAMKIMRAIKHMEANK